MHNMPPQKPFHVAVCGGGIGGLCLTIGLLQQKVSCTIYEAAPAFEEIGAGVSFGPNAVRAMELIHPLIAKGFESLVTVNGWPQKKETWFDFRIGKSESRDGQEVSTDTYVADVKSGNLGQTSVHRAHYLDELVKLVPHDVAKFGKRLKETTEDGEKVVLLFEDGTTEEADVVIGCDGIKSRTRQILLGANHPAANAVFSGKYAYRGLIPMDKAVDALGDELARNSQIYMGYRGHVLTFPIDKGKTMNVVAFRTKLDGKWDDRMWVRPSTTEDMFTDFVGWGDKVQSILGLMKNPDVWALFDHPPAPLFYKGRLCLLGDAAHATTPHQGAGAGQAIEDALVLSNLLGQVNSPADINNAFEAYDAVRRPRSQRVVTTSREASHLYELENETIKYDLEKARNELEVRCKWIWDEDLSAQVKTAQNFMAKNSLGRL
ncbi:hypothetical protein B0J14DRAFT_193698 [Halenospora varia]|nr:hypothetical protein B0J14DRAFT_193698 [Halenospora varia]